MAGAVREITAGDRIKPKSAAIAAEEGEGGGIVVKTRDLFGNLARVPEKASSRETWRILSGHFSSERTALLDCRDISSTFVLSLRREGRIGEPLLTKA